MATNLLPGANDVNASSSRPSQPDAPWKMRDGMNVLIRPIRANDEETMVRFHQSLSSDSAHDRYFGTLALIHRIEHDRLAHICHPDPGDVVPVAEITRPSGVSDIVAVARLSKVPGRSEGELALIVTDSFQHRGLGTELFRRLIRVTNDAHLTQLCAHVLSGNVSMLRICSNTGMRIPRRELAGEVKAVLDLRENKAIGSTAYERGSERPSARSECDARP